MAANPKPQHALVGQLGDEISAGVLDATRRRVEHRDGDVTADVTDADTRPLPVTMSAKAMYADHWPDDETADMLIEAVERWRRGGHA